MWRDKEVMRGRWWEIKRGRKGAWQFEELKEDVELDCGEGPREVRG